METMSVYLGTSIGLLRERDVLVSFIPRIAAMLDLRGIRFNPLNWRRNNLESYSQQIKRADLFVLMIDNRLIPEAEKELNLALECQRKEQKGPRICLLRRKQPEGRAYTPEFHQWLESIDRNEISMYASFNHPNTLKLQFMMALCNCDLMCGNDWLKVRNSAIVLNDRTVVAPLAHLPFVSCNPMWIEEKEEMEDLRLSIYDFRPETERERKQMGIELYRLGLQEKKLNELEMNFYGVIDELHNAFADRPSERYRVARNLFMVGQAEAAYRALDHTQIFVRVSELKDLYRAAGATPNESTAFCQPFQQVIDELRLRDAMLFLDPLFTAAEQTKCRAEIMEEALSLARMIELSSEKYLRLLLLQANEYVTNADPQGLHAIYDDLSRCIHRCVETNPLRFRFLLPMLVRYKVSEYIMKKDFKKALQSGKEGIALHRKILYDNFWCYAQAMLQDLDHLARFCELYNRYSEAETYFREELMMYKVLREKHPDRYTRPLSRAMRKVGRMMVRQERYQEAFSIMWDALKLVPPKNERYAFERVKILMALADTYKSHGDDRLAEECARESIALSRRFSEVNPNLFLEPLSSSLNSLSVILGGHVVTEDSRAALREAIDILDILVSKSPEEYNGISSTYRHNLSYQLLNDETYPESIELMKQAIEIRRSAKVDDIDNQEYLSMYIFTLGLFQRSFGLYDDALRCFEEAVVRYEGHYKRSQEVAISQNYVYSLEGLGSLLMNNPDTRKQGVEVMNRALIVARKNNYRKTLNGIIAIIEKQLKEGSNLRWYYDCVLDPKRVTQ